MTVNIVTISPDPHTLILGLFMFQISYNFFLGLHKSAGFFFTYVHGECA